MSQATRYDRSNSGALSSLFLLLLTSLVWLAAMSPNTASASADDLGFCGGDGQRGCCITETFGGGCDTNVSEFIGCDPAVVGSCQCDGGINATTTCLIPKHPDDLLGCGGPGQRACCSVTGEAHLACDNGAIEVLGCSGAGCLCGGSNPANISATSSCQAATGCGGPNQRACCIGEASYQCQPGLAEVLGCGPEGFCTCSNGLPATSTCYAVTACGGPGQRACCAAENSTACEAGLVEVGGCSGDCTCEVGGVSAGTCTPANGQLINEPSTNVAVDGNGPVCSQRGYMDMHLHLGGHLAHGGGVLGGKYYDPVGGVNGALAPDFSTSLDLIKHDGTELPIVSCPPGDPNCGAKPFHQNHLLLEDSLGSELATRDGATGPLHVSGGYLGAPSFGGWPKYTTTNHQQAYYKWLERAWQGGLRLTTMLAVSNTSLCNVSNRVRGTDCSNIMSTIDLQISDAWAFQAWLDQQSGGAGQGWFRIVLTPQEARQVIADGKLAVVLGIEVDHLFNCKFPEAACTKVDGHITSCDPALMQTVCSPTYVDQQLDLYYGMGVRHVFPIHNFDNSFGGTATWQDGIEAGNRDIEGHWWKTRDCGTSEHAFKLEGLSQTLLTILKFDIPFAELIPYGILRGNQNHESDCNEFGLFPLGEHLINSMMDRGMIIDIDHMSQFALEDTLEIAESRDYAGIVASHVQFTELNTDGPGGNRHERMRTNQDLARIRDLGGMIATMAKDDVIDSGRRGQQFSIPYGDADDTCLHSSRVFAQMYQYSVDQMQGPVAIGTDFNGIAGHIAPRYGSSACGRDGVIAPTQRSIEARYEPPLTYPFTIPEFGTFYKQTTGLKTYDYNVDGLAHIGLLPDMIADLLKVGLDEADLDPLFRGAQAYVDMWDTAAGTYAPPLEPTCNNVTVSADASCQATNVSISPQSDPRLNVTQTPGTTFGLGSTYTELVAVDACGSGSTSGCAATVTVVDNTPPGITCPGTTTVECTGATTNVAIAAPTANDNCTASPTASCPSGNYPLGSSPIMCTATDGAGNQSQCASAVNVVDTTPPTASCLANVDTYLDASGNLVIPENLIDAGSGDVCSGVTVDTNITHFSCANVGTNALTLTVTDGSGLSSQCGGSIIVYDTINPVATCQNHSVTLSQAGTASITPADINLASGDACLTSLTLTQTDYTCANAGSNFVQLWATDVSGNTAGCSANVEVYKRATTLTAVAGSGQFSDVVPLQVTLTDSATGNPLAGKSLVFTANGQSESSITDASGVALLPQPLLLVPVLQNSTVQVSFAEECIYLGSSASAAIALQPEDADVWFDAGNLAQIAADPVDNNSPPFSLMGFFKETLPDVPGGGPAQPGNLQYAYGIMTFQPVGPGTTQYPTSCFAVNHSELTGASYDEIYELHCNFDDVPQGDYTVTSTAYGMYDGEATSAITVPEPGLGVSLLVGLGMLSGAYRGRRLKERR